MIRIGNWPNAAVIIFVLFFGIFVIACGGGSSSDDNSPSDDDKPPTINNLSGIWKGTLGKAGEVGVDFVLYDGEIKGLDSDNEFYSGTYTATDGRFSATVISSEGKIVITGTASDQKKIDASYKCACGATGTLALTFNKELYRRDSSFELLAGEWSDDTANYSIDKTGGITGTFLNTCQLSGTFAIIDKKCNLYALEVDLTQCEYQGQYSGMAILSDGDAQNDTFIAILSTANDKLLALMVGHRQ